MNNYQQIKVLGEGGFGKAILVRQRSTGNMCVIKEVRLSSLSQKDRNEAMKEAKVLASLKHPNIVNYITNFQERGCFYIVMEYCDGGDLARKIAGRGSLLFSEDEVLHYFVQISLAIKYIHDRKILHRDLKAQNIFLTKDGTAKLGDFGIARVLEHTFQLCRTQIGTPYYLSPEICEGKNYNSKTDIWSLGCILYELCTLKRAFDGAGQRGILMKIVSGKYAPISNKYSQDLRSLVDSMLTKDATKRPTINEILKRPFIQNRLSNMLEKTILDYEFSHTIIHGRKPFAAPTVVIGKNSSENKNPNFNEKKENNKPKISGQDSHQNLPTKGNDKNRSPSEQRLIDQNFIKEQQQKKQQQQQPQQKQPQYQYQRQHPQNYPANVDPRYARRNYDIYGNARNPKQVEEQERERQRQIEELKRKHQQDENDRRARELKQQQQMDQDHERRQKQREIAEFKRIAEDREKQKNRLEQQKRELEEMKRLADEQNRKEEERRRASMEELRQQEEEFRKRREEAKRIMRSHEKEEEKKQAEEIERRRLEEVERKRKQVEEMVKRRQADADELKRIQEQKKRERLLQQQMEREQLEQDRLRIVEEEKARRRALMQQQRELREAQKKDLEDRRKRQLQDFHQNAIVISKNNNNNQIRQSNKNQKNETFIDNKNNNDNDNIEFNDIRGGYSYNDPFDPLEQTTADDFINRISKDGPSWAKMSQKRIPVSLDQTILPESNDDDCSDKDELASVQSKEFFDSLKSGSIKQSISNNNNNGHEDNENLPKTENFINNDTLGFTFIDTVPAWAKQNQNPNNDSSNANNNTKRGGLPYDDQFNPLGQTTADEFISKINKDGPAWAKMSQKRIPVSLDQTILPDDTITNDEHEDEFASVQSKEFFDSLKSGSIKKSMSTAEKDDKLKKTANNEDTLGLTFIDEVPSWANQNQNQCQSKTSSANREMSKNKSQSQLKKAPFVESFPESYKNNLKTTSSSRLLPDRITKPESSANNNENEDDFDEKEVDKQMNEKFMEEDDNKLSSLHDLAMTIKQALDIPDEKEKLDTEEQTNNEQQVFFISDEQVKLPVANDKKSLAQRQDAIRNLIEEKIGVETFIALNEELIIKEADDNAQTPIINNLPPGIVCLAQQWLMLDATSRDQDE